MDPILEPGRLFAESICQAFQLPSDFSFSFRSPISIEHELLHFHKNQQNYIEMISILAQVSSWSKLVFYYCIYLFQLLKNQK